MKDFIIIHNQGFDGGGATPVSIFLSNILNCPLFIKDTGRQKLEKEEFLKTTNNINIYNNLKEIKKEVSNVKIILITSLMLNKDGANEYAKEIRELYPDSYIIFFELMRRLHKKSFSHYDKVQDYVNEVFYYTNDENIKWWKCFKTNIDVNSFQFKNKENIPLKERKNYIMGASRYQAFKGLNQYLDVVKQDDFLQHKLFDNNYFYYEGFNYKISENTNKISAELGLINSLCEDLKTKKFFKNINVHNNKFNKDYLKKNHINIFSSYSPEDKENWKYNLVYICPTLCKSNKENQIQANKRLNKNSVYWNQAMEYTNLEAIDLNIPVLFSKKYIEVYCPELATLNFYYEFLEDIPDVIQNLIENEQEYNNVIVKQKEIITKKLKEKEVLLYNLLNERLEQYNKKNIFKENVYREGLLF